MAIFLDFAFLIIGLALNPDPHNHFCFGFPLDI